MRERSALYYREATKWLPIPPWAHFFLHLGGTIARLFKNTNYKLVVGLALPTRAYAAAFVAAGVVKARAEEAALIRDVGAHLENLLNLDIGTLLVYRRGHRVFQAVFDGVRYDDGRPHLLVRTQSRKGGGLTHIVPKHLSAHVSVKGASEDRSTRLPDMDPVGKRVDAQTDWLKHWLGSGDSVNFNNASQLDCIIAGNATRLREEIMSTAIGLRVGDTVAPGTLQDLVRVKRFMGRGSAYRADVFSVQTDSRPHRTHDEPFVTLFDGATGFLRWRENWRQSHSIVLLDRTEPNFVEATELLNQRHSLRPEGEDPDLGALQRPYGVELLTHWEER